MRPNGAGVYAEKRPCCIVFRVARRSPPHPDRPPIHDHLLIRLFDADFLPIDRTWDARNVRSSFWRLYVNSRPGAAVLSERGRHAIAPRRVHLLPAWVEFSCACDRAVDHLYIHFDFAGLPGPVIRAVFGSIAALAEGSPAYRLASALRSQLRDAQPGDPRTLCLAKSVVYLALAELIDSLPEEDRRRCQRFLHEPDPIRPAIRHIEAHLAQPITNADLAAACAMSEDHFIRVFRRLVGQTPAQYVLERRVAVAAQRLAFTGASIEAIAESVGFANRFHFTAAFSRRMGIGPAAYRKLPRA